MEKKNCLQLHFFKKTDQTSYNITAAVHILYCKNRKTAVGFHNGCGLLRHGIKNTVCLFFKK